MWAQLLGSGGGFTEPPPSFRLILFKQDKSAHGMVKKTQNREKHAERGCRVGREKKRCGQSQDQEGLSTGSRKKATRYGSAHPCSDFGWEEELLQLNREHLLLQNPLLLRRCSVGEDGCALLHPTSDVPRPGRSPRGAFLAQALPSFLVRAKYRHNEPRQDLGAGWMNPAT